MKKSVIILSLLLVFVLMLPGCDMPVFSGQDLGDPSGLVKEFVFLMQERKFAEASALLDSSVSLNLEDGLVFDESDQVTEKFADFILDSYSVEAVPGGVKQRGRTADIRVNFTSLSCDKLTERLAELVHDEAFYGDQPQTDEEAIALFNKVWEDEFSGGDVDMTEFYITREVTVQANYVSGTGWALVITEPFYNAMLGN